MMASSRASSAQGQGQEGAKYRIVVKGAGADSSNIVVQNGEGGRIPRYLRQDPRLLNDQLK
jgi:outer membrane protein assembly factor BamC